MKYLIALLALVSVGLKVKAVKLEEIERIVTVSPSNSVLYTSNATKDGQPIRIKRRIDSYHPLLLTAKITNNETGEVLYSDEGLSMCAQYKKPSFKFYVVRLFNRAIIGGQSSRKCPLSPKKYKINRLVASLRTPLDIDPGHYQIEYTAKWDNDEIVFSSLIFKFEVLYVADDFA